MGECWEGKMGMEEGEREGEIPTCTKMYYGNDENILKSFNIRKVK